MSAERRIKQEPIFASYEAAIAWMDAQSDGDSDDEADEIPMTCPPALNVTAHSESKPRHSRPLQSNSKPPSLRKREVSEVVPSDPTEDDSPRTPPCPISQPPVIPASSQSYFDQFSNFKPDAKAGFEDEFSRCMSSQGVVSGSQEYRRRRTAAITQELAMLYSQPPKLDMINEEDDSDADCKKPVVPLANARLYVDVNCPQTRLTIYQNMCREVGLTPYDNSEDCIREINTKVLVNIPDFIDARRNGTPVQVWKDFEAFSRYTMEDEHRIDCREAKKNGGFLACLLQKVKRAARTPKRRPLHARENPPLKRKFGNEDLESLLKKRARVEGVLMNTQDSSRRHSRRAAQIR